LADIDAPPDRLKREASVDPTEFCPGSPPAFGSPPLSAVASVSGPIPSAFVTPGASVASSVKFRPLSGSSVIWRPVIVSLRVLLSRCTSGSSLADIVTSSRVPSG
jgi:hypothetical protein